MIGATNRPDAVDSALRRPGRFDREFYFPLPSKTARKKIIGINTRSWSPKPSEEFWDQLAVLTKGYGGADLRASCQWTLLDSTDVRDIGVMHGSRSECDSTSLSPDLHVDG